MLTSKIANCKFHAKGIEGPKLVTSCDFKIVVTLITVSSYNYLTYFFSATTDPRASESTAKPRAAAAVVIILEIIAEEQMGTVTWRVSIFISVFIFARILPLVMVAIPDVASTVVDETNGRLPNLGRR